MMILYNNNQWKWVY